ncbi:hypothetical protein QBC40DRAFT_48579 [Triangularia verruculosa]|uniref:Uncharacterized protein n=1 Tax=Triangularia verruculosa TaxID=2587418 RepID=A0AAN7AW67_9PEZI|nr:hypothetical protein QBC40DRAFT_48579 [Triangularia verruculosa]
MASTIVARQYYRNCTRDEDGYLISSDTCYVSFWNTKTGIIVKWSLFLGILVFFALYLLIGYIHARKRVQAGLPPLGYHRFLVDRATLAQVDPRYRYPQSSFTPYTPYNQGYPNGNGDGYQYYHMQGMPPPPVYDPNAPRPPVYEPPAGATKVGEENNVNVNVATTSSPPPTQDNGGYMYAPPPGPPPPPAAVVAPVPSSSVNDQYAPPPGPPPPAAVQPQGTGNTNPFRS